MTSPIIASRNAIIHFFYRHVLKRVFFRFDPEVVHDRMMAVGKRLGQIRLLNKLTAIALCYQHPALEQTVAGLHFKNPLGLSAGFDKNAELTAILPAVGFGFAELGSITGEPCAGNAKPRLWRLKKSQGLLVYYGLKNDGSEEISRRLTGKKFSIPMGISVAKTNCEGTVDTDAGIQDYVKAYRAFANIATYFTINISCPNAFGGQPFTDQERLSKLLAAIDAVRSPQPIFLKLSPDLTRPEIDAIIEVARRYHITGFICTNLTKNRRNEKIADANLPEHGGMSGKIVAHLADDLISYIYQKTKREFIIIGCGGVFTAADAYQKIRKGSSLIQLITGMIFEGPQVISEINRGLVELLKKDGYKNISEAVGVDAVVK